MTEELTDFQKINLEQILEIIFRRKFLIILPIIVAFVCSLGASILSTPRYKSTAVLSVPIQRANKLKDIFKLAGIELRKDDLIEEVLKQFDSSSYSKKPLSIEQAVSQIKSSLSKTEKGDTIGFEYIGTDPVFCQKFLSALIFNVVSRVENIQFKNFSNKADEWRQRKDEAQKRFSESEEKFEQFIKQNPVSSTAQAAPVFKDLNYDTYKQHATDITNLTTEIDKLNKQSEDAQKKLAKEPEFGVSKETIGENPRVKALQQELSQLEAQLVRLQALYLPDHPDIKALLEQIAGIKKALDQAYQQQAQPKETTIPNPKYQDLKDQVDALSQEIKQKELQKKLSENTAEEYNKKLQNLPDLEREYIDLKAGYEANKKSLDNTKNELTKAEESYKKEKEAGPMLMLLEGPTLATRPFWPNTKNIMFTGIFFGIAIAVGLIFFLETSNTSIRHIDKLRVFLNLPVLGSIAQIVTQQDLKRNNMMTRLVIYGTLIFFVGSIAVILFLKAVVK